MKLQQIYHQLQTLLTPLQSDINSSLMPTVDEIFSLASEITEQEVYSSPPSRQMSCFNHSCQQLLLLTQYNEHIINQLQHLRQLVGSKLHDFKDILITQADGSRGTYILKIKAPNGLADALLQSVSAFSSNLGIIQQLPSSIIDDSQRLALSPIASQAVLRLKLHIDNNFGFGSDAALCQAVMNLSAEDNPANNKINVQHLIKQLGLVPLINAILSEFKAIVVTPSGMNHFPLFFIDRQRWTICEKQGKLCCTPKEGAYFAEPPKPRPRINMSDFKQTLLDLAFTQVALAQNMPVYGSCHGAQVAWLIAGGVLKKWNSELSNADDTSVILQTVNHSIAATKIEEEEYMGLFLEGYGSIEKICYEGIPLKTDFNHATVMPYQAPYPAIANIVQHPLAPHAKALLAAIESKTFNIDAVHSRNRLAHTNSLQLACTLVEAFNLGHGFFTQSHLFDHVENHPETIALFKRQLSLTPHPATRSAAHQFLYSSPEQTRNYSPAFFNTASPNSVATIDEKNSHIQTELASIKRRISFSDLLI